MQRYEKGSFISTSEQVLSREYFDKLDYMGDKTFQEFLSDRLIGLDTRMNAFKPHKEEGPIKKLSRF